MLTTDARRRVTAALAVPVVLLAVGGVGAAGAAPAATVAIEHYAFAPAQLSVNVGDAVTWTNNDIVGHDVTSTGGGGPLKSSLLAKGQSYTVTFTGPGTFRYTCTIHPDMLATVTVRAGATTTTPATSSPTSSPVSAAGPAKAAVAPSPLPPTSPPPTTGAPIDVAAGVGPAGATAVALSSDGGQARVNPMLFLAAVVVAVAVGATIAAVDPARRRSGDG